MRPTWIPESQWQELVAYANRYGTYPEVFAAIGWQETHWGTEGAGQEGYILGVGVPASGPLEPQYQGLTAQLQWTAPRVARYVDHNVTYAGLLAYARQVQQPSDPVGWATDVWAVYQEIGGPVGAMVTTASARRAGGTPAAATVPVSHATPPATVAAAPSGQGPSPLPIIALAVVATLAAAGVLLAQEG